MNINLDSLGHLQHGLSRNFNPQIRDKWIENIAHNIPDGSKVIDIGAGNCPYKKLFSKCQYFSHESIENNDIVDTFRGEGNTKQKHDYTGDITNLPIEDEFFDYVLCTEVLEHVPEPILAIKELKRICKKGGQIIITTPFTSGSHQQPYHFYSGFSPEFYEYVGKKYGLQLKEVSSQGDFFKLMCYFTNSALYFSLPGTDPTTLLHLRHYLESYYLTASELYGDSSASPADVSKHFTVGWMVRYMK